MKDVQIDDSLDVVFANGDIQLVDGDAEINQRVGETLRTREGEFEPEPSIGLSEENLYGKNIATDYVEQDIQDALSEQVPEAIVDRLDVGQPDADRNLTVNLKYHTSSGQINQQVSIDEEGGN